MIRLLFPLALAYSLFAEPVPDQLGLLTFDDSVASQVTFVAPLLKKHGFGATLFIKEGFEVIVRQCPKYGIPESCCGTSEGRQDSRNDILRRAGSKASAVEHQSREIQNLHAASQR